MIQLGIPRYTMSHGERQVEVHDGSITVTKLSRFSLVFDRQAGQLFRQAFVVYTCFIGKIKMSGEGMLYGRYVDSLIRNGVWPQYWACALAIDVTDGHPRLAALVPSEYASERSLFHLN